MLGDKDTLLTVEWFNITGDEFLVGDEDIEDLSMEGACEIMGLDINDYPLIGGGWKVTKAQSQELQKHLQHKFNFDKYEYYITSYAKSDQRYHRRYLILLSPFPY